MNDDTEPITLTTARFEAADRSPAHAARVDRLLRWTLLGKSIPPELLDDAIALVNAWLPESDLLPAQRDRGLTFRR